MKFYITHQNGYKFKLNKQSASRISIAKWIFYPIFNKGWKRIKRNGSYLVVFAPDHFWNAPTTTAKKGN